MERPGKPYPGFPLYAHNSGKWARKVRGRIYYFGRWEDPDAALREYLHAEPYLKAGVPVPDPNAVFSLGKLCDEFYEAKLQKHRRGELAERTVDELDGTCKLIVKVFGASRDPATLHASEFSRLMGELSKRFGLVRLGNEVQRIRSVFRWGVAAGWLESEPNYGPDFRKPSKANVRRERNRKPKRLFEPEEISRIYAHSSPTLRAMILLAINCGMGQTDISNLERRHLHGSWVDYPRPKTAVDRRCSLWPETLAQVDATANPEGCLFLTRFGKPFVRGRGNDAIAQEFTKARHAAGITRANAGFYSLRHTFRTVADRSKDHAAVLHVMGQADQSISSHYLHEIDDGRLIAVAETVRKWLFNGPWKVL